MFRLFLHWSFFLSRTPTSFSLRKQKRSRSSLAALAPPTKAHRFSLSSSLGGPSFPAQFSLEALSKQYPGSQITVRVHTALKSKQTRVSLTAISQQSQFLEARGDGVKSRMDCTRTTHGTTLDQPVKGVTPQKSEQHLYSFH